MVLHRVTEKDVEKIVQVLAEGDIPEKKIFCKIENVENFVASEELQFGKNLKNVPHSHDIPFYQKQKKIVLRDCGLIDPENIEEFIAVGGYSSLLKVLKNLSPEDAIKIVKP